jgi:nucleotide-binding universal stress UspA family protein
VNAGAIACGYDGSSDSAAALRWAAALAGRLGVELRIVHAVGLLEHAGLSARAIPDEVSARDEAVGAGCPPGSVRWVVEDGDPASVLCRQAGAGAQLLVVGTRGTGAHPGAVLGSTSLELAGGAPVPLVIVPSGPQGPAAGAG